MVDVDSLPSSLFTERLGNRCVSLDEYGAVLGNATWSSNLIVCDGEAAMRSPPALVDGFFDISMKGALVTPGVIV